MNGIAIYYNIKYYYLFILNYLNSYNTSIYELKYKKNNKLINMSYFMIMVNYLFYNINILDLLYGTNEYYIKSIKNNVSHYRILNDSLSNVYKYVDNYYKNKTVQKLRKPILSIKLDNKNIDNMKQIFSKHYDGDNLRDILYYNNIEITDNSIMEINMLSSSKIIELSNKVVEDIYN